MTTIPTHDVETNGIGRRFRELREAAGLTQDQVAEPLGLRKSAVSRIESGERGLAATELAAAAALFGQSADYILFGTEDEEDVLLRAEGDASEAIEEARSILDDLEFAEALIA